MPNAAGCEATCSKKCFKRVTHCIFDMDGTLVNSEEKYHEIIAELCEKYGKKYTKELRESLIGATDHLVAVTLAKELKLSVSANDFETELLNTCYRELPNSPLMKGALRLLTHLHTHKIPFALATNSTQEAVKCHVEKRPKMFSYFHHKVSVTDPDVARGKPFPDIYLVAASKFDDKPSPNKVLVFEDSPTGVAAARAAGMQVVMIPCPKTDKEHTKQATLVLRSLLEFKPELFGLPPMKVEGGRTKRSRLTSKMCFKPVTHCIFDMDGTLINSEDKYHEILAELCKKYGRVYTPELKDRLLGATDRAVCVCLVKELNIPKTVEEFEAELFEVCNSVLPKSPLMKGAFRLLTHLHDHKIPIALATNSTMELVGYHVIARPKIFAMFHHKVSATDADVPRGKPNPDIFLVCSSKFDDKPPPEKVLVFEDSPTGVAAAVAAGMQVVMVPNSHVTREKKNKATLVLRSLDKFKPEEFGLPPFKDKQIQ